MTKIKSFRQARLKSLRPSRRKPRNHRTDEPLTDGASQISTPRFGLAHALQAEPLTVKPPDIGREPRPPPGAHNLKAAPSKRSGKRSSPNLLIYRSKTGKPRHVLLTDEGAALFAGWCAGRAGSDLIFHTARGQPWGSSMQFAPMREAVARAKIKPAIGFQCHTWASLAVMKPDSAVTPLRSRGG